MSGKNGEVHPNHPMKEKKKRGEQSAGFTVSGGVLSAGRGALRVGTRRSLDGRSRADTIGGRGEGMPVIDEWVGELLTKRKTAWKSEDL